MNYEFLGFFIVILALILAAMGPKLRREWARDFSMLLSKSGRTEIVQERHHLHALYSIPIAIGVVAIAFILAMFIPEIQIQHWKWYEAFIPFLLLGFLINAWRERSKQKAGGKEANGKYKVPFSYRDCRYGAYGFAIAGMVTLEILKYFI